VFQGGRCVRSFISRRKLTDKDRGGTLRPKRDRGSVNEEREIIGDRSSFENFAVSWSLHV